ncbi:MAG TPA: sigma-70 family RNA polymerase sigma factor [Tepidisphaeraceae bacterium]|nr:sigma-70 family RNA polymerase sigma factor [Tepidisphaeraceae bacterium]
MSTDGQASSLPPGASGGASGGGGGGKNDTVALFEEAVQANTRRLLAIARAIVGTRASPEDVVQQAVMNLFQHRERYDWREPGGLLRRAVVNEALRLLRSPKMTVVQDDQPEVRPDEPSADMDRRETVAKVRAAIDKLPEHYRSALVLCEYEGMPYAEIATTLNASVPQIKTWIHRARRQLATMLKEYADASS